MFGTPGFMDTEHVYASAHYTVDRKDIVAKCDDTCDDQQSNESLQSAYSRRQEQAPRRSRQQQDGFTGAHIPSTDISNWRNSGHDIIDSSTGPRLRLGEEGYYTTQDLESLFEMWNAQRNAAASSPQEEAMIEHKKEAVRGESSSYRRSWKGKERKHSALSNGEETPEIDNDKKQDYNTDSDEEEDGSDGDENEDSNIQETRQTLKRKGAFKSTNSRYAGGNKRKKSSLQECETKRHECPICSKKFSRPSQLETHRLTHTGEAPARFS
ncbi:hypothetical protein BGZ54_009435 [Gamsiella multidivaricata]|nr:hypothetical protein BGZ54_009435 [Gamsiella multidivaricata]